MGHETFQSMLDRLVEIRDAEYRNDPDRTAARIDSMESILQSILEKLRDQFEPRRYPEDLAGNPAKGFGGTLPA